MKRFALILVAGLVAVVLWNGTNLTGAPDASLLETIAAGQQSEGGLAPKIVAAAFRSGGLPAANTARNWLPTAVGVLILLLGVWVLLTIQARMPSVGKTLFALALAGLVFVAIRGGIRWMNDARWQLRESALLLPIDLVGTAKTTADGLPVFASPAASRFLQVLSPTTPVDREPGAFAALSDPSEWRRRDREVRYAAVCLAGPLGDYRLLLEHLLASPDWRLAVLDGHGFLFVRGGARESTASGVAAEVPEELAADPDASGIYLARLAMNFAAAGEPGRARRLLKEAVDSAPKRPEIHALRASFFADRQQWGEAVAAAEESLRLRKDYPPALQVMVQAELAADRPAAAWGFAETLKRRMPGDPYSLFLHARAANAAGALYAEVDSLEKLVAFNRRFGMSTANYLVYLGQAYARQGYARLAVQCWSEALASGHLSDEKREEVQSLVESIGEKTAENRLPREENLP